MLCPFGASALAKADRKGTRWAVSSRAMDKYLTARKGLLREMGKGTVAKMVFFRDAGTMCGDRRWEEFAVGENRQAVFRIYSSCTIKEGSRQQRNKMGRRAACDG